MPIEYVVSFYLCTFTVCITAGACILWIIETVHFHHWGPWSPNVLSNGEIPVCITGAYGSRRQYTRICSKCGLAQFRYVKEDCE